MYLACTNFWQEREEMRKEMTLFFLFMKYTGKGERIGNAEFRLLL